MWLLSRIIKDISTERDGESFDITKILWIIGTFVFFAGTIFNMVALRQEFNPVTWGLGFGSILGLGSAGVQIKSSTEQFVPGVTGDTVDKTKETITS